MKTFKSVAPMLFTLGILIAFQVGMIGYGEIFWYVFGTILTGFAFVGTVYLGIQEILLRKKRNKNKYNK